MFQVLLSDLSLHLYKLTGGRDLVSSYTVELPPSWRNTECTLNLNTIESRFDTEDILVSDIHPVFDDLPTAQQFGGCGVRGSRLNLPFPILTQAVDIEAAQLNRTLTEAARWRFGVFSEVGSEGDAMYPANMTHGLDEQENAGCGVDELKAGGGLCPLINYNKAAATKQNLLCYEESARSTILNQYSGSNQVEYSSPTIQFVVPSDTERIILLLEQSQDMELHWRSVLSATFHYINSISEGVELAIITYSGEGATVHLPPTRVVGGNREGLHYRIPRRVSTPAAAMEVCVSCGLSAAGELATNTSLLLILHSSVTDKNNTHIMKFEQRANTIIRRVVVGSPAAPSLDISSPVYKINENQNGLNITGELNQVLATLSPNHPSRMFHRQDLETREVEGSFSVEASLSSDLWIQLLLEDTTDINVFEIKSPSGQIFSFPKFDAGLVYFSLRGPRETGVWRYRVSFYGSAPADGRMILECWGSGGSGNLNLRPWTKVDPEGPVYIYAKLDQAGLPVVNARLMAVIEKIGSPSSTTRVELFDSGSGYPDITRGDGVYSGYFTQFSDQPGYYSVRVEAINNSTAGVINTRKLENVTDSTCCGSSLPTQPLIPLESFRRFSTAPSFHLNSVAELYISSGEVQLRDTIPPNRITDFKLANYFNNSLFVTLAWTAPGNDYTEGRAFRYEIRCFTAREALSQQNFGEQGILVHSSLVPSPDNQGREQRCTVGVPWPQEVFYYAIVAYDVAGNKGEVSNVISVYVTEPVTTTTEAESTTMFLDMKDVSRTLPLKAFIHSESLMYIIAGIISFILIIIVIILTVIIRRMGVCGKKTTSITTDPISEDCQPPSLPDLCHEQSYMRNSISYMAGYDLPEMLDYALRSPQKASAQQTVNNNHRLVDQYMVVNSTKLSNQLNPHYHQQQPPSPIHQKHNHSPQPQHSPSISPVNSTFTLGQSTDCSVSVSGSDHEMVGEQLQVVTLPHHQQLHQLIYADHQEIKEKGRPEGRPEPKPRKIPPAVPNKTVHASLV